MLSTQPRAAPRPDRLASRYARVRQRTLELAAPLSPEDCQVQSMPDASPAKWHLAHVTWFFETFVLERFEPHFIPHDAGFRTLFNSYYHGLGDRHPRPQRGMLTRPTLEEVLRYRSPVQAMFRVTRADVSLHGQVIPAGKMVLAMIGSANRDPRRFQEPDRFDITREPNPHIAFGHGIHFCIGAPLSRLEARVGLSVLLERMRDFSLASDAPWEPRRAIHVHGPTRLPIRFTPGT